MQNLNAPQIIGRAISRNFLIITYDGLSLQIYTDKLENLHSFEITPMSYKVFYYELIFIPLGCLLALILTLYKGRFSFYICEWEELKFGKPGN